ncbi:MAG: biotin--[acetyl-CoA-carboxylase] ligase [Bacillota bacterium]
MYLKDSDAISTELIIRGLGTRVVGRKILCLQACESTNDVAKGLALQGEAEGLVVVAEVQTKGRGRLQRSWCSPPGGLWFSVLLRPGPTGASLGLLPLLVGLAVCLGIEKATGVRGLTLKWPNDVLCSNKKLCGILCESQFAGDAIDFVIVGIGINVNIDPERFAEWGIGGTSLWQILGHKLDRNLLLQAVLQALDRIYVTATTEWSTARESLLEMIRQRCSVLGRPVRITTGKGCSYVAAVEDLLADGRLVVRTPEGVPRLLGAADVTLTETYQTLQLERSESHTS